MEGGQKSQAKLSRTHSSLLRSSPTVRSSIHSMSSMKEITEEEQQVEDIEEQKPHKPGSAAVRPGSNRFGPVIAFLLFLLSLYTLFVYFRGEEEIPTSENVLLVLIFIAVALYFAGKNKSLIQQSFKILRQISHEYLKKLGFSKNTSKPVQWFIGDSHLSQKMGPRSSKFDLDESIVREGVEFYSNGDLYEGEFHKGKCNGSGVYNYFVNGRYEGDWIDGKYDGYGIESWARGSRYRGQYRQGLRHGYGVYRFYTGDSYAGEWFNGQSHGIGVQTCSDGSCFVGEFKCGVKHGLGCYHFR